MSNSAHFFIEEYIKPTFKVDLTNTQSKDILVGDIINMQVAPKYYFGGNIINTKGNYTVMIQNYFFDAKEYAAYQFGE